MNSVFVADHRTEPEWLKHGYEGCLKIIDSRRYGYLENAGSGVNGIAPDGAMEPWAHGWGVHQPDDPHALVLTAAKLQIDRLGLQSYGLDLEDGWFYDGPWGDSHSTDEALVFKPMTELLAAARAVLGQDFPLWVCIYPFKDYPAGTFAAAHVDVVVMLYGATDPLPNAEEAWLDAGVRYMASPIRQALIRGQASPLGYHGQTYRFDAEIMRPEDYLA